MTNIRQLDLDDDRRAAFGKAVLDLLKLDAEGARIITAIAAAWIDYEAWDPVEPPWPDDIDRAEGGEQFYAFQEIVETLSTDHELAYPLLPLAEARREYQMAIEAEEAEAKRVTMAPRPKRRRPRRGRPAPAVVPLVPPPDDSEPK